MADAEHVSSEIETSEIEDASRRGFIRAAVTAGVAGVAGLAIGDAVASDVKLNPAAQSALKISPPPSTPEEHAKDQKRLQAEALIKQLGGDVQIQWVKGNVPKIRRVIQMEG